MQTIAKIKKVAGVYEKRQELKISEDKSLDEPQLRQESMAWLVKNYPHREYIIKPMVFHDIGLTLTQWLKRKYKGEALILIPKYDNLPIRPDVIALAVINKNPKVLGWIIGECKVDSLSSGDLRQAVYYANMAEAYEGYLFYEGMLTREVTALVQSGGHIYIGSNKWGKSVKKRLMIKIYENYRFSKTIS